ncbi:MAG: formate--tetrahydrofolate ligase [Gracilimonas sp.]|nr:formate--tetrahydrofolate ligase [Gracilimonas sp.]
MVDNIKIAQQAPMKHMRHFMAELELDEDNFEFYGKYTGKIRLNVLEKFKDRPDGKLILVTAITPTPTGEGKTLTSIGLSQGLQKLGKRSLVALREPSLGPVFGIKGGAAGGGYSQVIPMERINLHFNGDIHAIGTAHNLLTAMLDNHIFKGNELDIDVTSPLWNRAIDMNDRALRQIVVGLGGRVNGIPRESAFMITAASEVMAILSLATSRSDLKQRLGNIVVGYNRAGEAVKAKDLGAHEAMAVVLNEAIMPNLVQTLEHVPALVHGGPFANIAHGTSSIIANKIGLKLADYVVTEAGFGADLGAEKFFDIVARTSDIWPSAVVLVATVKALKYHGGLTVEEAKESGKNIKELQKGLENLAAHIKNMKKFKTPVVVGINKFIGDTDQEIQMIKDFCAKLAIPCEAHNGFEKGGDGVTDLANEVVKQAELNKTPEKFMLYDTQQSIEDKIETIATEIYNADGVYFEKKALKNLANFKKLGYGKLPVCIAKTQSSISDNPALKGAPKDFTLTVTDVQLSAGAGFMVIICGNMMLMPGLPKEPAAVNMTVDDAGVISGLF